MVVEEGISVAELMGGDDGLVFGQHALLVIFFGFRLHFVEG